jgi:hypothetical protein
LHSNKKWCKSSTISSSHLLHLELSRRLNNLHQVRSKSKDWKAQYTEQRQTKHNIENKKYWEHRSQKSTGIETSSCFLLDIRRVTHIVNFGNRGKKTSTWKEKDPMPSEVIVSRQRNVHSNVIVLYSWYVIGQCCNFQGINSTVEISWDIFRILADYRLRHLVNNVAIHIITLEWR